MYMKCRLKERDTEQIREGNEWWVKKAATEVPTLS
jgi:hypothetical protein